MTKVLRKEGVCPATWFGNGLEGWWSGGALGPAAGAQAGRSWERTTEVTMDDSTAPYTLPGALLRDSIQKT
jgi:hypothetical protein